MRYLIITLALGILAPVAWAQNSQEVQALESQIREAERAGMDEALIQQLRDVLELAKQEEARSPGRYSNEPRMQSNHFDVLGKPGYSDCGQYDDPQAFAFCGGANSAFQAYTEAFAKGATADQLEQLYGSHVTNVENLVTYVDDF